MARILVVTAAKDADAFLSDAIDSIRAQTFTDWEYVVVDDGSTDATASVVEKYAALDGRIRLEQLASSVGPYAAANTVMLGADCQYLARLDADDVSMPDRFQRELDALARAPWARACTGAWQGFDETKTVGAVRPVRSHRNAVLKWTFCLRSNLVHSTLMIDTECFQQLGGYGPERVAEDFRLWARLVSDGQLAVVDDLLVRYRQHAKQITAAEGMRDQPERLRIRLDHLQRCSDSGWTLDDARDVRYVGRDAPYPVARGLALLTKWETAWRSDPTLDPEDRRELDALTGRAYIAHLRFARRTRPREVASEAIRHWPRAVRSLARVAASRTTRWQ